MTMKTVDDAIKEFKAVWPKWASGGDEATIDQWGKVAWVMKNERK